MKYINLIGTLLVLFSCTKYDKDNVYMPKPPLEYSIPSGVTCSGTYFCKTFSADSKVFKLTDSTFAVGNGANFYVFNDNGIQRDSINLTSITNGILGDIIPFWDGSGFFMFNFPNVYAFSNSFQLKWKSNTNLSYNYPDYNAISGPDNSLVIEAGKIVYRVSNGQSARIIADLSRMVDDIISMAFYADGSLLIYVLKNNYPDGYDDIYYAYELTSSNFLIERYDLTYHTKNPYRAILNRLENGKVSILKYENNVRYYPYNKNTSLTSLDTGYYNNQLLWTNDDLMDRSFLNSDRKPLMCKYLGNGSTFVFAEGNFPLGYLIDKDGNGKKINNFNSSNPIKKQIAGMAYIIPNTIDLMGNGRFLVSNYQYKLTNYPDNYSNPRYQYLMVFMSDLDGNFCK